MSNKTSSNCGAVELLSRLRQSQDSHDVQPDAHKSSRLEKYMAKGKEAQKISQKLSPLQEEVNLKQNQVAIESFESTIYEIDPYSIHRWAGKDRPENELGDIEDLAKSFKHIGQQVPCIVRPLKNNSGHYELIVGECRWHAAKFAKIKLKVIIHELDDRMASLVQAVENEKRNDLSEYAKGMSYAKKIEAGILNQTDLTDILGISKQQVSRLLSFRKIPSSLLEAVGDFRKVSARTAEEMSRLSAKGEEYIAALIKLAPKIQTGKFGWNRMSKEVDKHINITDTKVRSNKKVFGKDGRHLFTWRLDNNATPSIHFPKDIIQLLNDESIDFDEITKEFRECISKKLADLQN